MQNQQSKPHGRRSRHHSLRNVDPLRNVAASSTSFNKYEILKKIIEKLITNLQYTLKYYQQLTRNSDSDINIIPQNQKEELYIKLDECFEKVFALTSDLDGQKVSIEIKNLLPILNKISTYRYEIDSFIIKIYKESQDIRWLPSSFNPKPLEKLISKIANSEGGVSSVIEKFSGLALDQTFTDNELREEDNLFQAKGEVIPSEGGISTVIGNFLALALDQTLIAPELDPTNPANAKLFEQYEEKRNSKKPFVQLTSEGVFIFSKESEFNVLTVAITKYLESILYDKNLQSCSSIQLLPTKDKLNSILADDRAKIEKYCGNIDLCASEMSDKVILIPHWAVPYILKVAKFDMQDIELAMDDFYDAQGLKSSLLNLIRNSNEELGDVSALPTPNLSFSLYQPSNTPHKTLTINFTLPRQLSANSYTEDTMKLPTIIFLFDISGSMKYLGRSAKVINVFKKFYEQIPNNMEIGINVFNDKGYVILSRNKKQNISQEQLDSCLLTIEKSNGGTKFTQGFESLAPHIKSGEDLSDMVIVLVTDGGTSEKISDFIAAIQKTFVAKKIPHIYPIGLHPCNTSDISTVMSIASDPVIGNIGFQLVDEHSKEDDIQQIVDTTLSAIGTNRQFVNLGIRIDNSEHLDEIISLGTMVTGETKTINISVKEEGNYKMIVEVFSGYEYLKYDFKVSDDNVFALSRDAIDNFVEPEYLNCFRYAEAQIRETNIAWEPHKNAKIIQGIVTKLKDILTNYDNFFRTTDLKEQIQTDIYNLDNIGVADDTKDLYLRQRLKDLRITTSLQVLVNTASQHVMEKKARTRHANINNKTKLSVLGNNVPIIITDNINPTEKLQKHLKEYGKDGVIWRENRLYIQVPLTQKVQEVFTLILNNTITIEEAIAWFNKNSQTEYAIHSAMCIVK